MPCCGNQRAAQRESQFVAPAKNGNASPVRVSLMQPVVFEYIGATAISAIGSVTRKLYRFNGPKAQLPVDPRDAPSIARVPNLRRKE